MAGWTEARVKCDAVTTKTPIERSGCDDPSEVPFLEAKESGLYYPPPPPTIGWLLEVAATKERGMTLGTPCSSVKGGAILGEYSSRSCQPTPTAGGGTPQSSRENIQIHCKLNDRNFCSKLQLFLGVLKWVWVGGG